MSGSSGAASSWRTYGGEVARHPGSRHHRNCALETLWPASAPTWASPAALAGGRAPGRHPRPGRDRLSLGGAVLGRPGRAAGAGAGAPPDGSST